MIKNTTGLPDYIFEMIISDCKKLGFKNLKDRLQRAIRYKEHCLESNRVYY